MTKDMSLARNKLPYFSYTVKYVAHFTVTVATYVGQLMEPYA